MSDAGKPKDPIAEALAKDWRDAFQRKFEEALANPSKHERIRYVPNEPRND